MARMTTRTVALLIILFLQVAASAAPKPGDAPLAVTLAGPVAVPMSSSEHLPAIDVMINGGGPYRFAIDTGFAGAGELSQRLVSELSLAKAGEIVGGDPSGVNSMAFSTYIVDSLSIGSAKFSGVRVIGRNDRPEGRGPQTDGTIGFGLFQGLAFALDYPRGELRIAKDGGAMAGSLAYDDAMGIPAVEVLVAGTKVRADIDAGAPSMLTLPIAMAKTLKLAGDPVLVGRGRTVTNEFSIYEATVKGSLEVGSITLTDPTLTFVDLLPSAHFGARFLRKYCVTFDTTKRRVLFAEE